MSNLKKCYSTFKFYLQTNSLGFEISQKHKLFAFVKMKYHNKSILQAFVIKWYNLDNKSHVDHKIILNRNRE